MKNHLFNLFKEPATAGCVCPPIQHHLAASPALLFLSSGHCHVCSASISTAAILSRQPQTLLRAPTCLRLRHVPPSKHFKTLQNPSKPHPDGPAAPDGPAVVARTGRVARGRARPGVPVVGPGTGGPGEAVMGRGGEEWRRCSVLEVLLLGCVGPWNVQNLSGQSLGP